MKRCRGICLERRLMKSSVGVDCITSLNGKVVMFNYSNNLIFRICGDMLISVPYRDIADIEELELELSGGKALQVATKAGYEYILHI